MTRISRPYRIPPSLEQHALMAALANWMNAALLATRPPTWPELDDLLPRLARATRYGHPCGHCDGGVAFPHQLVAQDHGGWLAHYRCPNCSATWTRWWADSPVHPPTPARLPACARCGRRPAETWWPTRDGDQQAVCPRCEDDLAELEWHS